MVHAKLLQGKLPMNPIGAPPALVQRLGLKPNLQPGKPEKEERIHQI